MSEKRYNIITGQGTKGAPPLSPEKGRKCLARTESPPLVGAGCLPSPEPAESPRETLRSGRLTPNDARGDRYRQLIVGFPPRPRRAAAAAATTPPAARRGLLHAGRQEHLAAQSCIPGPGATAPPSAKRTIGCGLAPNVVLRASVDHLSGEACAVRDVQVQATAEDPPPVIQRQMVTKAMADRMGALAAKQDMHRSQLYSPGEGYKIGVPREGSWPATS